MKCPKCNYTSFDYNDNCPRCGGGLADVRTLLQIIAVSPEERIPTTSPRPLEPETKAHPEESQDEPFARVADPEAEPEEDLFEGLDFEESFDDLVERTSYEDAPEREATPKKTPPKPQADDGLLDLDFGDLFGDETKGGE